MTSDFSYLEFIEKYHPRYHSDDRVLLCDILFRYLTDDGVSPDDLPWLQAEYETKDDAVKELVRTETALFSEALENFYKETKLIQ